MLDKTCLPGLGYFDQLTYQKKKKKDQLREALVRERQIHIIYIFIIQGVVEEDKGYITQLCII
jgi:hypothetical protein